MHSISTDRPDIRREKRYNHIAISIRFKTDVEQWEWIRALDWNDSGFNFFHDGEIRDSTLIFKKGRHIFLGTIVWRYKNNDDNVINEIILNDLVFTQLRELEHNYDPKYIHTIINLCRSQGNLTEKRKLLDTLGYELSDEKLKQIVSSYKKQHLMYRYGVKVDSKEWAAIIADALDMEVGIKT